MTSLICRTRGDERDSKLNAAISSPLRGKAQCDGQKGLLRAYDLLESLSRRPLDMRYMILACDYDGTIARDGIVDETTIEALESVRQSGRKLILVTGRELDGLLQIFP